MSSVAIINLGTRDLQVKDNCIDNMKFLFSSDSKMMDILNEAKKISSEFREFTRILFESLDHKHDKWLKYIEFPIIEATLQKLNDKGKVIDKIVFIASDQSDSYYSKTDTKYLSEILLKLKQNYNELFKINPNIEVDIKYLTKNPSDYDITIEAYKNILNEFKEADNIYLGISGGTPAMATGLIINSINTCDNVMTIYTKKKENNKQQAYALNLAQELKKNESKKDIIKFIKAQNYSAAEILIKEFKNKFSDNNGIIEEVILNIVKAASSRIQFDFTIAKTAIEEVMDKEPNSREIYEQFIDSIEELTTGNQEYLLNEVISNAEYQYSIGAYTDFLGRVFRIQEEIYSYILLKNSFLELNNNKKKFKNIEAISQLSSELNNFSAKTKANIPNMDKVLKSLINENSEEYDLYKHCSLLTNLKTLRNNSILAHGYEGVSDAIIKSELPNGMSVEQFLEELIEKFKNAFNVEIYTDDFYQKDGEFNKHLIKLIEEL